jgi:hypothetical protein
LKQLVNDEKNKAVYESVEDLKKSGGVGYVEPGKVITFDGNTTGKDVIPSDEDRMYVRISDEAIDLSQITVCNVYVEGFGNFGNLFETGNAVVNAEGGIIECVRDDAFGTGLHFWEDGTPLVLCVPEAIEDEGETIQKGIYVLVDYNAKDTVGNSYHAYIDRLETADTIHPIDSKYIPTDEKTLAEAKAYSDSKGGYTEPGKEILSFEDGQHIIPATADRFVVGEKYIVHLEHGEFEAVCKLYDADGIIGKWLGNMAISDIGVDTGLFEDTGEDYCVYYLAYPGVDPLYAYFDRVPSAFCRVSTAETVVPIKPEYLPGVCLPVVELSTAIIPDGNIVALTEAECNALTATAATGLPIVLKLRLGDQKLSAIAFRATDIENELPMYLFQFSTIGVNIFCNSSSYWEAVTQFVS